MIAQKRPISPPIPSDDKLVDFTSIIQSNMQQLFQVGHIHVGINGVLPAVPGANDGAVGDIVIVNASGAVSLYLKVAASQWYHCPATPG